MPASTLHENILNVLTGSSSQNPMYLADIRLQMAAKVKSAELTAALDSMCQSRELQTCNGVKDGKAYVCYWISGNLPPAWGRPSKVAAAVKKPATVPKKKS